MRLLGFPRQQWNRQNIFRDIDVSESNDFHENCISLSVNVKHAICRSKRLFRTVWSNVNVKGKKSITRPVYRQYLGRSRSEAFLSQAFVSAQYTNEADAALFFDFFHPTIVRDMLLLLIDRVSTLVVHGALIGQHILIDFKRIVAESSVVRFSVKHYCY